VKLVLFDLDNTLLSGDSDFEWAQFLIGKDVLDREVYEARNLEFLEAYRAGTLDIRAFLDFQLKPLSRHPRAQLDEWHEEFMEKHILPIISQKARDLVGSHEDDARAVVTATNSFVTWPIAREFGLEHLIATEPEQVDGEFSGRVHGIPAFREGKVERLREWLTEHGLEWDLLEETWFYSDSLNDLPLLSIVSHPVAVDPDETLKEHALEQGWQVISLR
jgi:HAD superfamily hydrolase (TIGR01490 family)